MWILIAAAVLPAAFLTRYIYKKDTIEKEPGDLLWKLFLFGVGSCIPAVILEQLGTYGLNALNVQDSIIYHLINAFVVVAFVEEGCKYFFLKRLTWRKIDFNYRFDGIVYAAFVALGFATFENIQYVLIYGFQTALVRAVTSVPAHMGFGVYMGVFFGEAKECEIKGHNIKKRLQLKLALIVPVIFHGIYDCALFLEDSVATTFFIIFVVVMYIVTIWLINRQSKKDHNMFLNH